MHISASEYHCENTRMCRLAQSTYREITNRDNYPQVQGINCSIWHCLTTALFRFHIISIRVTGIILIISLINPVLWLALDTCKNQMAPTRIGNTSLSRTTLIISVAECAYVYISDVLYLLTSWHKMLFFFCCWHKCLMKRAINLAHERSLFRCKDNYG